MKAKKITQKKVFKQIVALTILIFSFTIIAFAQPQNCLDFDGEDDLVLIAPSPVSGTEDLTVEFWALSKYNNPNAIVMVVWDCATFRLDIRMDNGKLSIYAPSVGLQISEFVIPQDIYFHVALTNGSGGTKVYANCELVLNTPLIPVGSANIRVGRWCHDYAHKGQLDEFRIWNYPRTKCEIQSTMNMELIGDEPGLVTYLDFNQGIANGDNNGVTITPDKTGNGFDGVLYDFSLTGNTSNWVASLDMYADCLSLPEAIFSFDNSEGCAPFAVQFYDESICDIDSWYWSFPGGSPSSSTEQNPEVVYNMPGSFDVTLEVTNSFGSNSITFEDYILINEPVFASFNYSVNNSEVIFNNTTQNATAFQWDFGDNSTSTQSDPNHNYAQSGIYTVQLIALGGCGPDTMTQEIIIDILDLNVAAFSLNNGTGCTPLLVQFADESDGVVESWNWTFPGGTPNTSTEQNPQVIYQAPGIYDVSLEVTNAVGSDFVAYEELISVELSIFAGFDYSVNENMVEFTSVALNASTFTWNFGDGSPLSFEENPIHTYNQSGVYLVTLVASNSYCGSGITQNVYVFSSGTEKLKNDISIEISPIPFQDQASIQVELDDFQAIEIEIYSPLGQLIESHISENNSTHFIEIGDQLTSNGIYLVKIKAGDSIHTAKIMKWK